MKVKKKLMKIFFYQNVGTDVWWSIFPLLSDHLLVNYHQRSAKQKIMSLTFCQNKFNWLRKQVFLVKKTKWFLY